MATPYIGEIRMGGWNFAPRGNAYCAGQLLPIQQNQALFSLLGTQYGGNGTTTFGLPDLRGRVPISFGQGPGLSNFSQGQVGGTETVTLLATQMPGHTHTATFTPTAGTLTVTSAKANAQQALPAQG
jgi:microcystin-dependent protein